ncbi:YcaO-like family protein [Paenibacillus sp. MMS20-IR301]|uniref:YcaO-like family protein n=1 Tax=Paenibacillus sp. MMS20-IR301 TaxID=2895946 RepID=UPI0028E78465|nr:YcaO-like family protein [Paenibacillus sp. MMS20-IR301]WNS43477.1 YcaO-like family protein [Paenibacillus sp. MMS20-IR301]
MSYYIVVKEKRKEELEMNLIAAILDRIETGCPNNSISDLYLRISGMSVFISLTGKEIELHRKVDVCVAVGHSKLYVFPLKPQGGNCVNSFLSRLNLYYESFFISNSNTRLFETIKRIKGELLNRTIDFPPHKSSRGESLSYLSVTYDPWSIKQEVFVQGHGCPGCTSANVNQIRQEEFQYIAPVKAANNYYQTPPSDKLLEMICSELPIFMSRQEYKEGLYKSDVFFFNHHFGQYMNASSLKGNSEQSMKLAILEAVERYSGTCKPSNQVTYRGSYDKLIEEKKKIVNVQEFGLEGQNKTVVDWIEVFSWKAQNQVLIPEELVYYKHRRNNNLPIIGNSNGNSVGTNLIESVFYGVLEVIERDAFLNHWYLRRRPKRIDLSSVKSKGTIAAINRIQELGYSLHCFDITTELGIPTIWLFAEGCVEPSFATYTTTGISIDPAKALDKALEEMLYAFLTYTDFDTIKEQALRVLSGKVSVMQDHPLLYALPQMRGEFDFLFGDTIEEQDFDDNFPEFIPAEINLTAKLQHLLTQIGQLYGNVYIADLTPKGFIDYNIKAVKVVIPGLQQLWFGADYISISEQRLRQIANYWKMVTYEVNVGMHPYP